MTLSKNAVFSAFLLATLALIVNQLIPPSVDEVIELTLSKNKTHIKSIHQKRIITETRVVMIDEVDLTEKNHFRHSVLGTLGWGEDFFADIETKFQVHESGRYRFEVGSDDGFELKIDNKITCQFKNDRPFKKNSCIVSLTEGAHVLRLSYFQGFGNAGLSLKYASSTTGKLYFWGEASTAISYLK